jgi:5-methylcytosine-specific restriction endonuclease McrA
MGYRNTYRENNKPNAGGWYKCTYCDKSIRFSQADIDHVWPQSRGGSNSNWNLVVACQSCNRSKGNKIDGRVVQGYITKIWS